MLRTIQAVPLAAVLIFSAGHLAAAPAGQGQRSTQSTTAAQRSAAKPLIEEMTALDLAIREVVSAIAQSDGLRVTKALDPLRGAMERTQQASRAGALSLPKNGDRLDDFQRRHESFQAQMDALARAGQRNDIEAMLMITKQLLEGCVSCHRTFR